jgi:SH3-like domain-containing protein
MLLLFVVADIFAYAQKQSFVRRSGAIIMAPAVTVKSTPAKQGTDHFILDEGTRVEITDGTMRQWKRIRLADGKEGWIETSQLEII